jgi:hypothetical protein
MSKGKHKAQAHKRRADEAEEKLSALQLRFAAEVNDLEEQVRLLKAQIQRLNGNITRQAGELAAERVKAVEEAAAAQSQVIALDTKSRVERMIRIFIDALESRRAPTPDEYGELTEIVKPWMSPADIWPGGNRELMRSKRGASATVVKHITDDRNRDGSR